MDPIRQSIGLLADRQVVCPSTLFGFAALVALLVQSLGQRAPDVATAAPITPVVQTITLAQHPVSMLFDSQHDHLLIANTGPLTNTTDELVPITANQQVPVGPGTVTVFDGTSLTLRRTVQVGANPTTFAYLPLTDRIFVLNSGIADLHMPPHVSYHAYSISMLDAATDTILTTLHPAGLPVAMAVKTRPSRLYVLLRGPANDTRGTLATYDGATGTLLTTTRVGFNPDAVAYDPANGHLFVTNGGYEPYQQLVPCNLSPCESTVTVVDGATGKILASTVLPDLTIPNGPHYHLNACAVGLDAPAGRVIVVSTTWDIHGYLDEARTLDARTGILLRTVNIGRAGCTPELPATTPSLPSLQVDSLSHHAFLLTTGEENEEGDVKILDTRTGVVLGSILVGHSPSAIIFDKLRGRMFIGAMSSPFVNDGAVSAIASSTGAIVRRFPLAGPDALAEDPATGRLFVLNQQPDFEPPGPSTLLVFSPAFSH